MKPIRQTLALAAATLAVAALGFAVEARQFSSIPGTTAAAEKAGWWIRVNPQNQASHVFLRFGAEPSELSPPMGWIRDTSPEAIDVPEAQRSLGRVHIAAIGMPPGAPVSLCLFYADRGVALIEFTQETLLEVEQGQAAEACIP